MFELSTISCAGRGRTGKVRSYLAAVAAALIATFVYAPAASAVVFDISVSSTNADSPSEVTTTLTPSPGEATFVVKRSKISFPVGWKVNNPDGLTRCSQADFDRKINGATPAESGNACPQSSAVGSAVAEAEILGIQAAGEGTMYLLESDESDEPVRVGVEMVTQLGGILHFPFLGNVTLEGPAGQERIVVDFSEDIPDLPVFNFALTVEDILRSPAKCGAYRFDSELTTGNNAVSNLSDTVNVAGNCNYFNASQLVNFAGYNRQAWLDFNVFRPVLKTRLSAGSHPNVNIRLGDYNYPGRATIKSRANDGAAGYQTIDFIHIRMPSILSINGTSFANGVDLGDTTIKAEATSRIYTVRGDVLKDVNGLELRYTDVPKVINGGNSFSLRAELDRQTGKIGIKMATIPTAYEIREFHLTLNGTVSGSNLISRAEGRCKKGDAANPFDVDDNTTVFFSDRGAMSMYVNGCSDLDRPLDWAPAAKMAKPAVAPAAPSKGKKAHKKLPRKCKAKKRLKGKALKRKCKKVKTARK